MLFAPHPDDESLACGLVIQRAVAAGAAVRVVYVTDGENNPWPQRVLERKWRLNAEDRKQWGKLRRVEALAALNVLGVRSSNARFLALPDQGLTTLLIHDCRFTLDRLAAIIRDWSPTHLLIPSVADLHPDHSALAVILRLVLAKFFRDEAQMSVWRYMVHLKNPISFERAQQDLQSERETKIKLRAIHCHKTQLKLSRRRFLAYARRPERLFRLGSREATISDSSIRSISRQPHTLHVDLRLSMKSIHYAGPLVFLLGHDATETLRCITMELPVRSCNIEMRAVGSEQPAGAAQYRRNGSGAMFTIPIDLFSPGHSLFIKLERRSWFFDEAGWLEIPVTTDQRNELHNVRARATAWSAHRTTAAHRVRMLG
ncbi:MAG TPA: PIG-L family deacetylase [Chthoniobacterales bacterium]|jgi:LmbE family N-acetylglucosaminyl deacetylase